MREIRMYQAFDGECFPTPGECEMYENQQAHKKQLERKIEELREVVQKACNRDQWKCIKDMEEFKRTIKSIAKYLLEDDSE